MTSARIDAELVRRGLARSRAHAGELVKAGRVSVHGKQVSKPSASVGDDVEINLVVDPDDQGYASRAALKLAGVLEALAARGSAAPLPGPHTSAAIEGAWTPAADEHRDPRTDAGPGSDVAEAIATPEVGVGRRFSAAVEGAWCLDLGASTGGFTDVLLRRGAAHVVAVDVGHDQLVPRLRDDQRVTVVEGYNVRDLDRADLERSPDLVVGDLSFISLSLVLPPLAGVLEPGTPALLMVKPQFEVGKDRLGAGGVVRDRALQASAVLDVVAAGAEVGLVTRAVVPSPLPGPSGNREYFVAFERGEPVAAGCAREAALEAVAAAVAWQPDDAGSAVPPVIAVDVAPLVDPVAELMNPSLRTGGAS